MRRGDKENDVQRSVGLQGEQQTLGGKRKGSGEFNQMPIPSLWW